MATDDRYNLASETEFADEMVLIIFRLCQSGERRDTRPRAGSKRQESDSDGFVGTQMEHVHSTARRGAAALRLTVLYCAGTVSAGASVRGLSVRRLSVCLSVCLSV